MRSAARRRRLRGLAAMVSAAALLTAWFCQPAGAEPSGSAVRIHDLQGDAWLSPYDDQLVTDVPGVVTAVRTSGSSRGFWIQDPQPDDDPATSEGIFVFRSKPGVAVGDSVLVSGTVQDYYPLGSGETVEDTSNLSTTEISAPTVTMLDHDQQLPAAEKITAADLPDTYAPDLGGGNIEKTALQPKRSVLDFWEAREGMRVQVDDARVVGPSNSYGEQFVTIKPDESVTYRGGTELRAEDRTPTGRIKITPIENPSLGVNVGDVITGATVGPVEWSAYGGYSIDATEVGPIVHHDLARGQADPQNRKQLAIATYNVENLAPSDPDSKFAALAKGIVDNLAKPDIVAVEEIQDNSGDTDNGVVGADRTLQQLTAAIIDAGGPSYAWRQVDPVNDRDGGEPGGNIRVAFLYNPDRVSFVDRGADSVDRSITGTKIITKHGKPALSLSPGRIDPANRVWDDSRKPLVGEFSFRGKPVFVIANHFDSKGGDQNADGRFQYPDRSSEIQRAGQALAVHDFVRKILATDRRADVVVAGDLNDYQFSPALSVLRTGVADASEPPILADLISTLPASRRYTYVYNGISQVLDHILTTRGVGRVEYQVIHLNAEYAQQTSDHDPQVVRLHP
ncbi:endonuclease/exonuclease/phosphatase [Microlunatus elymi]|uniref:Endonuclease/exonuclease/phosphatase n=2 Tax=Microlunatus elymi TaxID=2596828 RepID=A0A516Q5G1_9ACTN|nr:endonuclease/exonuclease/phosphatase [Microlunatus elymi]